MSLRASFAVLYEPGANGLHATLGRLFTHPWVASYQIGFGPPLIRSIPGLEEEAAQARGAVEKLGVYLRRCLDDDRARSRLVEQHRRDLVRRRGPVEAEDLSDASEHVWDLSLRLHLSTTAPPAVAARMAALGCVDPRPGAPDGLIGRFRLHLHDPTGQRLLEHPELVARSVPAKTCAIELRVFSGAVAAYRCWLREVEAGEGPVSVELGEPTSHARGRRFVRAGTARSANGTISTASETSPGEEAGEP